jgi:hypothetical protein
MWGILNQITTRILERFSRQNFQKKKKNGGRGPTGPSSREGDDWSGDIVDGELGCPAIVDNHDTPKAVFGVTSPLQDGFSIKGDFATFVVEKYLAPCIAQDRD